MLKLNEKKIFSGKELYAKIKKIGKKVNKKKPVTCRAWPGGCGFAKMGSNYAPTLWIQQIAAEKGCHQVREDAHNF